MGFAKESDREQTMFWTLDELVAEEAMVRVIDRFIDVTDLEELKFKHLTAAERGRPRYPTHALAKLYVYGYENGIRSSRRLERETYRNVEVMWLMGNLRPDHKTISEFRRENGRSLQKLFRKFVKLCREWELVGGELEAVDGSKFKASNNKKKNFSRKKLTARLADIDKKIEQYMAELDAADRQDEGKSEAPKGLRGMLENAKQCAMFIAEMDEAEDQERTADEEPVGLKEMPESEEPCEAESKSENRSEEPEALKELQERKELYESYLAELDKTGANEISVVDPDARLMGNNRGGVEMAYNVQSTVDAKHHIILDYNVSLNPSDHGQLSHMVKRLKRLGFKRFKVLADKGYYNGEDLLKVKRLKVKAIVARQDKSDPKDQPEQFHYENFSYDKKTDTYRCPTGQTLHAHNKKSAVRRNFFSKEACANCPNQSDCSRGKKGYRTVTRSQYSKIYEEADRNFKENAALYKLRQQIVEHPFGTVKHTMNGGYFLLRTRKKVRCEVALLFLGYNLKRAYNVLGFHGLMARLEALRPKADTILRFFSRQFHDLFEFLRIKVVSTRNIPLPPNYPWVFVLVL